MLLFDGGLALIAVAFWLFCLIDVITTPEEQCRNLPKVAWILIVLFLAEIGSIVWLVAGRTWQARPAEGRWAPAPQARPRKSRPTNPDDDEEFLAGLRARAEEQRRRARDAQQTERDEQDPGTVS
ncbi:MAG TPA: PLD nuclease N-terminal domain-containing protein [Jatrophihabitantaceae bacterium]|nr:PLD nuclease N-terminal domain-containing protein [Jatrophihabitantaceae bacterium]